MGYVKWTLVDIDCQFYSLGPSLEANGGGIAIEVM